MNKKRNIATMTIQVSVIMFIIKILGVLKQSIIAAICGATAETDAYFIASGIIIALCSVVFSAVSISFLSMYTERLIQKGRKSANNLVNVVLRAFMPISIVIALLFLVFAPFWAKVFAPSYEGVQLKTLTHYIRIMAVMFVFSGYTLILNVVLEADKRFLPGKFQNLFQNAFIIIAAVFFYRDYGMNALLYAFIIAGMVQCIQITWCARELFKIKFKVNIFDESHYIKKLIKLIIPLLMGNAIYEINDIVDKQIASSLGHGSVSFLSYGASINEIVSTLIISSVSTVLFSHYATWIAEGAIKKIEDSIKKSLEILVVIIMPVMVMCFVCGDCIVAILYGRGSFGIQEIRFTTSVVWGYAIGFFFQAARANIIRVYYAFQDTKTPMINGIVAVCANICMSIGLSKIFGVGGIAMATSIAMLLVTILLLPGIKKYINDFNLKDSYMEYIKIIISGMLTGILSYFLRKFLNLKRIPTFLFIGIFVVAIYIVFICLLRVRTVTEISNVTMQKLKKDK